jgi:hypothetical protein
MPAPAGVIASARFATPITDIPAVGLQWWYDADDAASFTLSGANITQWRDKSGKERHLSAAGTTPPKRSVGTIKAGRGSVDLDGTAWLSVVDGNANQKPFSVFGVVRHAGTATYRSIIGCSGSNGLSHRLTNAHRQSLMKQYVAEIGQSTTPLPTSAACLFGVTYSAAGVWAIRLNSAANGGGTNDQVYNAATNTLIVGNANGEPLTGNIAELIKYDRVLTAAEINQVEAYLSMKWGVAAYLTPTVGTATTPDPVTLPNDHVIVMRVRGPAPDTTPSSQTVCAQYETDPQRSWLLRRSIGSALIWTVTPTGTAAGATGRSIPSSLPSMTDERLALAVQLNDGAGTSKLQVLTSDGGPWSNLGAAGTWPTIVPIDSTGLVRIGAYSGTGDLFKGIIYSVEMRSGLDPAAGTVLWRFDANDYPGGGVTSYVDPRGRTWTLTNAAAITPKG